MSWSYAICLIACPTWVAIVYFSDIFCFCFFSYLACSFLFDVKAFSKLHYCFFSNCFFCNFAHHVPPYFNLGQTEIYFSVLSCLFYLLYILLVIVFLLYMLLCFSFVFHSFELIMQTCDTNFFFLFHPVSFRIWTCIHLWKIRVLFLFKFHHMTLCLSKISLLSSCYDIISLIPHCIWPSFALLRNILNAWCSQCCPVKYLFIE